MSLPSKAQPLQATELVQAYICSHHATLCMMIMSYPTHLGSFSQSHRLAQTVHTKGGIVKLKLGLVMQALC